MKKRNTFVGMAIFIAILILGVGYAAISEIPLTLNGTANIKANADFNVVYDTAHNVLVSPDGSNVEWDEDTSYPVVAGSYESTNVAKMTVYLDATNKTAYAIYKIDNKSEELKATIASEITQDFSDGNEEYLSLSQQLYTTAACDTELGTTELGPNESAYLKVTVNLIKLPLNDVTNAIFTIGLTATPVEVAVEQD